MKARILWPAFLCRGGTIGDPNYEERQFNSEAEVPEGEGWERITPNVEPQVGSQAGDDSAAVAAAAKLAQQVSTLTQKVADLTADNQALNEQLDKADAAGEQLRAFYDAAGAFLNKAAATEGLPEEVAAEIKAIFATAPDFGGADNVQKPAPKANKKK